MAVLPSPYEGGGTMRTGGHRAAPKRILVVTLALPLVVMALACGGGGGGGGSPTSPAEINSMFSAHWQGYTFGGSASEMTLEVDGELLGRATFSNTGAYSYVVGGNKFGLRPGRHTVRLTIVKQSKSTLRYTCSWQATYSVNGGSPQTFYRGIEDIDIRTGQSVSWTIDIR
jgi:hypothetical protein